MVRDFARQGVEVLKASTLAEAIRLCETEHPDLAIIDLFLEPPEDGLQLLTALRAIDSNLFTILVSAHMSVAHAVMCVRAGADDVFLKPFKAGQALARFAGEPTLAHEQTVTLKQIEWEHIARALQDYDGNISHAAEALGVYRQSLQRKMKRYAPRVLLAQGQHEPTEHATPPTDSASKPATAAKPATATENDASTKATSASATPASSAPKSGKRRKPS